MDHPLRALEAQGLGSVAGEIIDLFLESAPLRLQELRAMQRAVEHESLRAVAHSLRGASVQMGLRGMADLLARLDAALAQRQPIDATLDALEKEFETGRLSLHDARRRLGAGGPEA